MYNNFKDIFVYVYLQIRRQDFVNFSGDFGFYGSVVYQSESVFLGMFIIQFSNFLLRKYFVLGGDYFVVQYGNILLELMKQIQNFKYLLSQGQDVVGVKSISFSVNFSDILFFSGLFYNLGVLLG